MSLVTGYSLTKKGLVGRKKYRTLRKDRKDRTDRTDTTIRQIRPISRLY